MCNNLNMRILMFGQLTFPFLGGGSYDRHDYESLSRAERKEQS